MKEAASDVKAGAEKAVEKAKEDMKAAASDAKAGLKEAAQPLADAVVGKEGQEASAAIK